MEKRDQMTNFTASSASFMHLDKILHDPFCEAEFWNNEATTLFNPVCTATACIMIIMAFIPNFDAPTDQIPKLFLLCKSSLAITGVGTVLYHGISPTTMANGHINHALCDWFPILLLCSNILIMYLIQLCYLPTGENGWVMFLTLILSWVFVLVVAMDSETNTHFSNQLGGSEQGDYGTFLNVGLLTPLAITLCYAARYHMHWKNVKYLLGSLGLSVTLWLINAYLCRQYLWLFIFHAIYHITIAYAFLIAACLGVTISGNTWRFEFSPCGWPTILPAYNQVSVWIEDNTWSD